MTRVVVGAAEQKILTEVRGLLAEVEDAQIVHVADTTSELSAIVGREKPNVVLVHDKLGPQRSVEVVRDLVFRSPATAVLVINSTGDIQVAMASMEAGAKSVLSHPVAFEDLLTKFEAAAEWSERMGGLLTRATPDTSMELGRHGRVTLMAGAKGGVGTTTVVTHLAINLVQRVPGIRVCVVDLDLQAGDVSAILDARQRVSIADVAKVSQDLDSATIMDALIVHETGISLLLTPLQVQDTSFVTPDAIRSILGLLRQQFHVILVDGGSHVTPAQAAAIEVADEVVAIVTPDVLAMRSFHRMVKAWEGLGVRTEPDLRVLVNRVSRDDALDTDRIGKLTSARILATQLPAAFRRLERGVNRRDPREVREVAWWDAIERVGAEIGVSGAAVTPVAKQSRGARRGKRRGAKSEAGQLAIETVGLVPIVAVICLLVWQIALTSLAFVWNGHAANAAGRAQSIGADPLEAARDAVPDSMRDKVFVSVLPDGAIKVSTKIPVLCPGCGALPGSISQTEQVVSEP